MAQPQIPSHLPSSCSQGQSPQRDLQPPPAAFPTFPRGFLGTLGMLEGPELPSLFQLPGHPCGARGAQHWEGSGLQDGRGLSQKGL